MYRPEDTEMKNDGPITCDNIRRAATALGYDVEETKVADMFVAEGASPEEAGLMTVAGRLMLRFAQEDDNA